MARENKMLVKEHEDVTLVRILGKDIRGDKKLISGLTTIKGISWSFANALCKVLQFDPNKKIQEMTPEDLKKIEDFMSNPAIPVFMKNRQKDFETGENSHLYGPNLKLKQEFDIKRLRKIKSYKGIRHAVGLPVRGQRTKANFRKNRKKSGVKK
jgi:small subunit ribosomal protein S13